MPAVKQRSRLMLLLVLAIAGCRTAPAPMTPAEVYEATKALAVDIYRPLKRYIGVSVDKTGNGTSATSAVFAIQYKGKKAPVTQDTDEVYESVQCISPTT